MTKQRATTKSILYKVWATKAQEKSDALYAKFNAVYKDFDWTQPILLGHHSQRRHENIYNRRRAVFAKMYELNTKAKRYLEKAENLLRFANTHKGDAERKRQIQRDALDTQIIVGTTVYDFCFGKGIVKKVNKKTYTICFTSGSIFTREKTFVKVLN